MTTGSVTGDHLAPGDLQARADELLRRAPAEPRRVEGLAAALLSEARRAGDRAAASTAAQARGLAARELNDIPAALGHLRAAVSGAQRAGLAYRAAQARVSLSATYAYAGQAAPALREATRAAAVLKGADRARLEIQRAGVLARLGRLDEALAVLHPAAAELRRAGDPLWEARLGNTSGLLHAMRGELAAAERDLSAAQHRFADLGDDVGASHLLANRAWLAGRRGDIPAALALFDQADEQLRRAGLPVGVSLSARCEVLLSAHLVAEARAAAAGAVAELQAAGMAADAAEALLKLSHAAVLDGDAEAAATAARQALRAFVAQRRPGWVVAARWALLRARWAAGDRSAGAQRAAAALAPELSACGWAVAAHDARILAGRIALERGRPHEAAAALASLAPPRGRGPVELRVRACHAQALLRLTRGDRAGAGRALHAGVRLLHQHRASLGATELRTSITGHGVELARLGLGLALGAGRPWHVLTWIERGRAASLRLRPARPPADAALAADLARLRRVAAELEAAGSDGAPPDRLLRQQAALEAAVRQRARHAHGSVVDDRLRPLALPRQELVGALGGRALVELAEHDGRFVAVVVVGGRAVVRPQGPVDDVRFELESLRFSIRRLLTGRASPGALSAARTVLARAADRLDELLLAPVRPLIGSRPLVLVPPGELHALPWSLLPTCRSRPVSVAPSAAAWLDAARRGGGRTPTGPVVLVSGPDVPHGAQEVLDLAASYPQPVVLTGGEATVARVLEVMDGADVVHVAAHGSFRADNPLFSSVRLADGPLTVYDLETLGQAPRRLVLSACDSGLPAVRQGDELMGLGAALFALGTATLVASVWPVPDAATRRVMLALHQHLMAGHLPAEALLRTRAAPGADDATLAAASGFTCFGWG